MQSQNSINVKNVGSAVGALIFVCLVFVLFFGKDPPDYAELHYAAGEYNKAIPHLEKIVFEYHKKQKEAKLNNQIFKTTERHIKSLEKLGKIYLLIYRSQEKQSIAISYLTEVANYYQPLSNNSHKEIEIRHIMARYHISQNDKYQAYSSYSRLSALNKSNTKLARITALLAWRNGKIEEAIRILEYSPTTFINKRIHMHLQEYIDIQIEEAELSRRGVKINAEIRSSEKTTKVIENLSRLLAFGVSVGGLGRLSGVARTARGTGSVGKASSRRGLQSRSRARGTSKSRREMNRDMSLNAIQNAKRGIKDLKTKADEQSDKLLEFVLDEIGEEAFGEYITSCVEINKCVEYIEDSSTNRELLVKLDSKRNVISKKLNKLRSTRKDYKLKGEGWVKIGWSKIIDSGKTITSEWSFPLKTKYRYHLLKLTEKGLISSGGKNRNQNSLIAFNEIAFIKLHRFREGNLAMLTCWGKRVYGSKMPEVEYGEAFFIKNENRMRQFFNRTKKTWLEWRRVNCSRNECSPISPEVCQASDEGRNHEQSTGWKHPDSVRKSKLVIPKKKTYRCAFGIPQVDGFFIKLLTEDYNCK